MKKPQIVIILFFFIQGVIHNLGHPVTPALVTLLDIEDYFFGIFFSLMSLGMTLGALLWGFLGDKYPKKFLIIGGLIVYSIGQIAFGYSGNEVWMMVARFVSGFGVSASLTLYMSEIIHVTPQKSRTTTLAYVAAATTLGTSLGYALGGYLATSPFFNQFLNTDKLTVIFLIQGLLNLLYVGSIALFFNEKKEPDELDSPITQSSQKASIPLPLILFLISLFFITVGQTNVNKYIDVHFEHLGYLPSDIGFFVMTTGYVSLAAAFLIVPILIRLKKPMILLILIQFLSAVIIYFVFHSAQFLTVVYTVFMGYILLKAFFQPLEQNYIATYASTKSLSKLMGIRHAFVSMGMVVGPLIGGWIYSEKPLLLFDVSAACFVVGGIILMVVFIIHKISLKKTVTNDCV